MSSGRRGRGRGGGRVVVTKRKRGDHNLEDSLDSEGEAAVLASVVVPSGEAKSSSVVAVPEAEKAPKVSKTTNSRKEVASEARDPVVNQSSLVLAGQRTDMSSSARIDARLLACFGGFTQLDLNALDYFFTCTTLYGSVEISKGLLKLAERMHIAIDTHNRVYSDLAMVNARMEEVFKEKVEAERKCEQLAAENALIEVS